MNSKNSSPNCHETQEKSSPRPHHSAQIRLIYKLVWSLVFKTSKLEKPACFFEQTKHQIGSPLMYINCDIISSIEKNPWQLFVKQVNILWNTVIFISRAGGERGHSTNLLFIFAQPENWGRIALWSAGVYFYVCTYVLESNKDSKFKFQIHIILMCNFDHSLLK